MRFHLGKTALAIISLVELGACAGALLCWAFIAGWAVIRFGAFGGQKLLGTFIWAGLVGGPVGAIALPLLGMTVLRKTPLSRALGYPFLGSLLGVVAASVFVTGPRMLPVPMLVPALGFGGLFLGVAAARAGPAGMLLQSVRRLHQSLGLSRVTRQSIELSEGHADARLAGPGSAAVEVHRLHEDEVVRPAS